MYANTKLIFFITSAVLKLNRWFGNQEQDFYNLFSNEAVYATCNKLQNEEEYDHTKHPNIVCIMHVKYLEGYEV